MSIGLEFSKLNSERFVKVNEPLPVGIHTLPIDKILFQESLFDFEKNNNFSDNLNEVYFSKKERDNDIVCVQVSYIHPVDEIKLFILECDGTFTDVSAFTYADLSVLAGNVGGEPAAQLYTLTYNFKFSDITSTRNGKKYLFFNFIGSDFTQEQFISEPIMVAESWENTQIHRWSNDTDKFDTVFTLSPTNFNKRFDSILKYKTNKIDRTMFTNQKAAQRNLYSKSWNLYDLIFGSRVDEFGISGINHKDIELIGNIQKCSSYSIDDQRMIMDEGSEMEPVEIGNNYPLYNLTLQMADFNPSDTVEFYRGARVFLFDMGELPPDGLDSFPYAIDFFKFINSFGVVANMLYDYPTQIKEILDTAMQTTFVAELNAKKAIFGMTGNFVIDSDKLYYDNVGKENWGLMSGLSVLRTCLTISFSAVTSNRRINLMLSQMVGARTIISLWNTTPTNVVLPNNFNASSVSLAISSLADGAHKVYLYSNNKTETLSIYTGTGIDTSPISANRTITSLAGAISSSLREFYAYNLGFTTFDFSILKYSSIELRAVGVYYSNITAITTLPLIVSSTGQWKYFNFISFSRNNLTNSQIDAFFNNYTTFVFGVYFGSTPLGYIDTQLQESGGVPTGTSITARNTLTSAGYSIII